MTSLDRLKGVVAPELIARAEKMSRLLTDLSIPHLLIGGLAVGVHGHVRATRDIDFLVGDQAFATHVPILTFRDELRDLVRIGHTDLMSVPPGHPQLQEELSSHPGPPVISLPALIMLKLEAGRPRDAEDVRQLMALHRSALRDVRDYLQRHAPGLVHRLAEVISS